MNEKKRRLKINFEDLQMAMANSGDETSYYLDQETGEVFFVSDEDRSTLESLLDESGAETFEAVQAVLQAAEVPDWEKERLLKVAELEFQEEGRFLPIPRTTSSEGYGDMEAFIEAVESPGLKEVLFVAIQGKGAFRRFKDALAAHPQERECWFQFQDTRARERALDWLEDEGIQPVE